MAREPLGYTRSLIDKLQKDLSRIAFGATIAGFALSLLYYIYSLAIQIVAERYVTMGVYVAITLVSIAVFVVYLTTHNLKELEKRYTRERLRAFLSWALILLRLLALGFTLYQWFALSISDFDKIVTIAMLVYLLLQAIFEILKSFLFHYLDLFKLGFEEDKKTLGDDIKGVVSDYLKEAIAAKFKRGKEKNEPLLENEDPSLDIGPYEKKLRMELKEAHDDFSAKQALKRAEKNRLEKEEPVNEKPRPSSFFSKWFARKEKEATNEEEKTLVDEPENKVK